jgi:hypothetical protein
MRNAELIIKLFIPLILSWVWTSCQSDATPKAEEEVFTEIDSISTQDELITKEDFSGLEVFSYSLHLPDEFDISYLNIAIGEQRQKLMDKVKDHFPHLVESAQYSGNDWKDEFKRNFIFFDWTGDGKLDLIYTGWGGGEADYVRLFTYKNDSYNEVLTAYQRLVNVEFEGDQIKRIIFGDPGCCDAYIYFETTYDIVQINEQPQADFTNRTGIIRGTYFPTNYFDKPIRFQTTTKGYTLRSSPSVDGPAATMLYDELPGNAIGIYPNKTTGVALAEYTDNTGRIWYFVEIDPECQPDETAFYDITDLPTIVRGWMISSYLTVE